LEKKTPLHLHDFLGVTFDYSFKGKVQVRMVEYIDDLLLEMPDDMRPGIAPSPAGRHLFEMNDKAKPLEQESVIKFHHLTAKLLFLSCRARPELKTTVAFLPTRVKCPDFDAYKKLGRVLKYLHGSKDKFLTLEADDLSMIKTWVDASFAVHHDREVILERSLHLGKEQW
jgi:hypothetical protein